jgi:hypothetical protein
MPSVWSLTALYFVACFSYNFTNSAVFTSLAWMFPKRAGPAINLVLAMFGLGSFFIPLAAQVSAVARTAPHDTSPHPAASHVPARPALPPPRQLAPGLQPPADAAKAAAKPPAPVLCRRALYTSAHRCTCSIW